MLDKETGRNPDEKTEPTCGEGRGQKQEQAVLMGLGQRLVYKCLYRQVGCRPGLGRVFKEVAPASGALKRSESGLLF